MQEKHILENLVSQNLSTTEISKIINLSQTGARYWLKKYGLKTTPQWSLENKRKFTDQNLLDVWAESDSVNQFCLNLGVGNSGGAWYHYKKRLEKLGIDLSNSRINGRSRGGKKTAMLANQRSVKRRTRLTRKTLKKSMDLAGVEYRCNNCSISEWLTKKILLHIHHKDSDKTNNHIDNLEYLCPNCHGIEHYTEE